MLFQALSAKLGIVTGKNLAEHCRDATSRPVRLALWGISEVAAMATDLAEFLGGAIGLSLLTGMPLMAGMAVTAIVTYAILLLEHEGFRPHGDRHRRDGRHDRPLLRGRAARRAGRLGATPPGASSPRGSRTPRR